MENDQKKWRPLDYAVMPRVVVIVDLDGTLVEMGSRIKYIKDKNDRDWPRFHRAGCSLETPAHADLGIILRSLAKTAIRIHIVTGRNETYRSATEVWLRHNQIPFSELTMRPDGDFRPDVEYKGEVFAQYDPLSVLCIFEDRERVVEMARERGYTVYHVRKGAF